MLSPDDLVQRIQNAVAALTGPGCTLGDSVQDGLRYELPDEPSAAFNELKRLTFLAGLPSLPCCATHDEHVIDEWVATVTRIVDTGQLPD